MKGCSKKKGALLDSFNWFLRMILPMAGLGLFVRIILCSGRLEIILRLRGCMRLI